MKTALLPLTAVFLGALTPVCNGDQPKPRLLFKSGFEGTTHIAPRTDETQQTSPQQEDIVGEEDPKTPGDWQKDIENSPYFSGAFLNYEQGDFSQRRAEIVPDPLAPNNHVMRFRINEQHITLHQAGGGLNQKARIQLELFNKRAAPPQGFLREYYQKCRLFFSPDFKVLEDVPDDQTMGWMVMQEFWNDPQWKSPGHDTHAQARTGVEVFRYPNKVGGKLRFGAKGRSPVMANPANWDVRNTDFEIPLGKWMTQELYVKEGDANTGRFVMTITVDGKKTVVIDQTGLTTSNSPGYVPDGQTSWTPFKVYSEGTVAQWFKAKNLHMDVLWDDLEIWANRQPDLTTHP